MSVIACKRIGAVAAGLGLWIVPAALGQTPAMDRVPAGAPVIVTVPNLAKLEAAFALMEKTFGIDPKEGPLADFKIHETLALDGINKEGSLALAVVAGEGGEVDFEAEDPQVVLIVPVTDYAKFAAAGGADPQGPVGEWNAFEDGEPAFCKNIGNGFAAVGSDRALVEAFKGTPGNSASHVKLMGANGRAVLDSSLLTVVTDLQALAPQIKEGFDGAKERLEGMAQMAGRADAGSTGAAIDALGEAFTRDGQAGVFGFSAAESGLSVNLAAQFKEGTETAGYFNAKGKAASLLERVPNHPNQAYLFAAAMDTASPALKKALKTFYAEKAGGDGAAPEGITQTLLKTLDTLDGGALVLGNPPGGVMTGLFTSTSIYARTRDASVYTAVFKESLAGMNGKTVQGFTYQTSYNPKAKTVGSVSADQWSMRMEVDPNDPNAQQSMMAMGMMFGMDGGPTGYLAPVDGGVVTTFSSNTQLLEQAVSASKGGGLTTDAGVKSVQGALPADRTFEGYFGVKSLLEMFIGFAAMMGGAPEVDVPQDLPPIGFGGTTTDGGVRLVVFAPTQVLTTIKKFSEAGENMGEGPQEGAGQPRF